MTVNVEELFQKSGALLKGHFLLTSGRHSPVYWEKFRVLQFPQYTAELCQMIARHFQKDDVRVVAGPTTGGIIIAYEVARQLGVRSVFAEKEGDVRRFRRGFNIDPGERVLIVDDILTTGGSIHEVIAAVNNVGGKLIGIGVLVNRAESEVDFGVPLYACLRSRAITYTPAECPLCAAGVPLVKPGSSQQSTT